MRIVAAAPPRSATPDVDAAPPSAAARRTALSALAVSARIASATSRLARSCTSTCRVSSLRSASAARDEGSEVSGSPPPVRPAVSVISHAASISASISLPAPRRRCATRLFRRGRSQRDAGATSRSGQARGSRGARRGERRRGRRAGSSRLPFPSHGGRSRTSKAPRWVGAGRGVRAGASRIGVTPDTRVAAARSGINL